MTSTQPLRLNLPPRLKTFSLQNLRESSLWPRLSGEQKESIEVVGQVMPFKTNNYVIDQLLADVTSLEDDPLYLLTFFKRELLTPEDFSAIASALRSGDSTKLKREVARVRKAMNPHPAGQSTLNVPKLDGQVVAGVQHKYRETMLVFPSAGQTCFAYCTFCFRWPQFVETEQMQFATDRHLTFLNYLLAHNEISDVLFTGGDPLIMSARHLEMYLAPLCKPEFEHVKNIRIGTKVLSYWPNRLLTDPDCDAIFRLFEKLIAAGKSVNLMAHINHPRELSTLACQQAIRKLAATGVVIRGQSPLLKNVNDDAKIWRDLWNEQVRTGIIPYYMFVERDTGPKNFFEVPLVRAHQIFKDAYQSVSGLARTVRGPSMSCTPGKICVEGEVEISGRKLLALKFLQARKAEWCNKIFFAEWNAQATWFDGLKPAFNESEFFFQREEA